MAVYKSKREELLEGALNSITNREKFNYDFNADPMYQMYKDQYTKLGNEAAMNAAANVSALTGGYGNSYATTAAAQANQQYLTKLNEQIPSLYQNALNKYMMEGDSLKDTYNALADAESRDYSKYRDEVGDEQWQKSFDESNRQWQEGFDYGKERDKVSDEQWQKNFDYGKERDTVADEQWQKNFDYAKERDAVSDSQWRESFDYGKERDKVSDSQADRNYEMALRQLEESINQYNQNMAYNKERDAVSDAQWRENFDYNKSRDTISDAQWRENFDYGKSRDTIADAQWQAQFDENNRRYNQEYAADQAAQEAANALAWARLNQSSGNSGGEDKPKGVSAETMNEIKKTAYTAHLNSMDKASGDTSFGNYLDSLVEKKKLTEDEADEIMRDYLKNKI